ncbi:hypothetical protein UFOVP328_275 [uncultured Caudovirales phage]|uniref:Tail tube protein n=1 Tax=uncultured Caudovirales phage TaxID=2100421 RepID=A0A6J5LW74_9CAUD|nr:hypothetical protein UFOVP328_275 [uncultured Caudovirales phage]
MAVSSLTRMTVPLASDQSNPTQGLLMPKLKYRFRVIFENFGVSTPRTELTKQVMDFTRPSVSFEEMVLDIYNSKIKLAGKHSWDDLTCQLRDDAGGNVSKLVGEQLQKQLDFAEQASAASGIDYKFLTRFEVLDGGNGAFEPVALETWEIYGCYLKAVNYNDMNYATSEAATISMTLAFDNAVQTPVGQGIGALVGRTVNDVATGAG